MAEYVDQQTMLDWIETYGSDWSQQFTTSGTGDVGKRIIPGNRRWMYKVSQNHFDITNISPYVWCHADSTDIKYTNTYDTYDDDFGLGGVYKFYEGSNLTNRLQLFSGIYEEGQQPAQEGWKYLSWIQSVSKSTQPGGGHNSQDYGYPILSYIGMPVFRVADEGTVWCDRLRQYLDNPTDENFELLANYLYAHALNPRTDDPNEQDHEDPESEEGGGDGNHDRAQTPVPIPGMPPIGGTDAGFVTCYRLSLAEMHTFAADLFDPDAWAAIKAFFADPMDFICGVMIMPFLPPSSAQAYPKFGAFTWSHAYDVISSQFIEIDCGSILIPKYYGSCFDFDPYTKIKIWLPYIGYRDLPVDEVMGRAIKVVYHCDVMTGDCVAFITRPYESTSLVQVIAQFSGNMGVRVPFGRVSFDAAVAASIQLLGGAVGLAVGGAAAGLGLADASNITASQIAGQVSGATVGAANAMKTRTERSGTAGASAGFMSVQKPYIIRQIPRQSLPAGYKSFCGYPANLSGSLGSFSGFTAVESIKLRVTATDDEKAEIIDLLRGGVFV